MSLEACLDPKLLQFLKTCCWMI